MAYVVHERGRYRVCQQVRTPKGPRRRNLASLGSDKRCSTVASALEYWRERLAAAQKECRVEVETHPDTYKHRRSWQRAARLAERSRKHIKAIARFA
jgi:hypothetical protein